MRRSLARAGLTPLTRITQPAARPSGPAREAMGINGVPTASHRRPIVRAPCVGPRARSRPTLTLPSTDRPCRHQHFGNRLLREIRSAGRAPRPSRSTGSRGRRRRCARGDVRLVSWGRNQSPAALPPLPTAAVSSRCGRLALAPRRRDRCGLDEYSVLRGASERRYKRTIGRWRGADDRLRKKCTPPKEKFGGPARTIT
jgi:hypothetical protein